MNRPAQFGRDTLFNQRKGHVPSRGINFWGTPRTASSLVDRFLQVNETVALQTKRSVLNSGWKDNIYQQQIILYIYVTIEHTRDGSRIFCWVQLQARILKFGWGVGQCADPWSYYWLHGSVSTNAPSGQSWRYNFGAKLYWVVVWGTWKFDSVLNYFEIEIKVNSVHRIFQVGGRVPVNCRPNNIWLKKDFACKSWLLSCVCQMADVLPTFAHKLRLRITCAFDTWFTVEYSTGI
jgi:hypothetical protein